MHFDIGLLLNGRNDIRTNHRFRFTVPDAFIKPQISADENAVCVVEFTEDDVRAGLVEFEVEKVVEDI